MWHLAIIVAALSGAANGYENFADVPCGIISSNGQGSTNTTGNATFPSITPRLSGWQRLLHRFTSFFVVGGQNAVEGKLPFIVSLSYYRRHFCGASLIHRSFVLTAAHCYDPRFEPISNIEASVGEYDLSLDDGQEYIPVSDYIMHESFDPRVDMVHDIALYKLQFDVTWGPSVQPVCLPDLQHSLNGRTVTAAGWGTTSYGGPSSDILQTVRLPVVSNSVCRQLPKLKVLTKGALTRQQLCAGLVGFQDTCQGDSGGPLTDTDDITKRRILVGLTSYGFMCAVPFAPGIYTRVSAYIPWINNQIYVYSSDGANTRSPITRRTSRVTKRRTTSGQYSSTTSKDMLLPGDYAGIFSIGSTFSFVAPNYFNTRRRPHK